MLKKPAVSLQRAACCIVAPARAEAMLLDLVPRTVLADQAYLRRVPAVLTALVRASVEVGQTPAWVADETLEAIAEMTPEFLEDISGPSRRPGDGASRLALDIFATDPDAAAPRIALLEETMGSASALAEFDASAVTAARRRRRLPARRSSIDVGDAPSAVRDAAVAVDAGAADAIRTLFPTELAGEYRAAVRTLIERLLAVDPDTLRRGKPVNTAANTAAALCWAVRRAQERPLPSLLTCQHSGVDAPSAVWRTRSGLPRRRPARLSPTARSGSWSRR